MREIIFRGRREYNGKKVLKLPMTNADRIRAMSDEELKRLLFGKISCGSICAFCVPTLRTNDKCDGKCRNGVLKWLQQPAEESK